MTSDQEDDSQSQMEILLHTSTSVLLLCIVIMSKPSLVVGIFISSFVFIEEEAKTFSKNLHGDCVFPH